MLVVVDFVWLYDIIAGKIDCMSSRDYKACVLILGDRKIEGLLVILRRFG